MKEANRDKTEIGIGNFVTVKVRENNEKIREVKIIRMSKELVAMSRHLLLNFLATLFFCCCRLIFLQSEIISNFWAPCCF